MTVDVVTRTRDRPMFLRRASRCVRAQTKTDLTWIVVNDGGARSDVDACANDARAAGLDVVVIHHPASLGMEAAGNAGVRAGTSPYVVIHDDDDSWEPEYLSAVTARLDECDETVGAISWSTIVRERVATSGISAVRSHPFAEQPHGVDLAILAARNLFPPIALTFRRETWAAVGGFDETLPVLGDWDFNLRLLREGDIDVVPQRLANWHVRANLDGPSANTVTRDRALHLATAARIRNRYIRTAMSEGHLSLGNLLAEAQAAHAATEPASFAARSKRVSDAVRTRLWRRDT